MKSICRVALIVATSIFLIPLSARAEIKAGSFEVDPFVGYNFFQNSQNLKNSFLFGGRFGYNFTKHWGVEGAIEFTGSGVKDTTRTGVSKGQFRSPTDKVEVTLYHVDAVYHFMPDSKLTPFVLLGIGAIHYSPTIADQDVTAFNVGVGAKYWVADHIALRVDLKDYIVTEFFDGTYNNIGLTFGVTFAFGSKTKTAPMAEAEKEDPVAVIIVSEQKAEARTRDLALDKKMVVIAFEDIHFDFNKSTLTKEAQITLKKDMQILKDNPKANVRIAGYTSASGSEEYNQILSEKRADAVKAYLVKEKVVAPNRLSVIGYGSTKPIRHEAAPKNYYSKAAKANMRVLFEIAVN